MTVIGIISYFSTYILQVAQKICFGGQKVKNVCLYLDHFELAIKWLINYTGE